MDYFWMMIISVAYFKHMLKLHHLISVTNLHNIKTNRGYFSIFSLVFRNPWVIRKCH